VVRISIVQRVVFWIAYSPYISKIPVFIGVFLFHFCCGFWSTGATSAKIGIYERISYSTVLSTYTIAGAITSAISIYSSNEVGVAYYA